MSTSGASPFLLLADGLDELMVHPLPLTNEGKAREQLLQVLAALA